jgi:predicted PurR-regulated permease PerM
MHRLADVRRAIRAGSFPKHIDKIAAMDAADKHDPLRNAALAVIAFGVVVAGLAYGRSFLVPLAVAFFIRSVLEATIQGFAGFQLGAHRMPRALATIMGFAAVLIGLYLIGSILLGQADAVASAWPRYVARFETIIGDLTQWLGPEYSSKLKQAMSAIDLTRQIPGLIASTQSVVGSMVLVLAYLGFMFAEGGYVGSKIAAMFPDPRKAQETALLFHTISESVQRYIWIKTVISVLTAAACYVVMRLVGVDFAATWALLIFVLNYIPNIGSILGVVLPSIIALVQFETLGPFLVLVTTLTAIQFTIGSVLDPMLMGTSLNMSPFAIILGLAFWGTIWGVAGMFLSVPILVVVMIVCAHVPSWRWVAILLSKDGRIAT